MDSDGSASTPPGEKVSPATGATSPPRGSMEDEHGEGQEESHATDDGGEAGVDFGEWAELEQSIIQTTQAQTAPATSPSRSAHSNVRGVRDKWLQLEKTTWSSPTGSGSSPSGSGTSAVRKVGRLSQSKVQLFHGSKDDKDDEERPAPRVGNVFQFLHQKQKQVGEEVAKEEAELMSAPLPPLPPIPAVPPAPAPELKKVDETKKVEESKGPSPAQPTELLSKKKDKKEKKSATKKSKKDSKGVKKVKHDKEKGKGKEKDHKAEKAEDCSSEEAKPSEMVEKKPMILKEPYVMYNYVATDKRMISVEAGKAVKIVDRDYDSHWYKIECEGQTGLFPSNYLHIPPTIVTAAEGAMGLFDLVHDPDNEPSKDGFTAKLQEGALSSLPIKEVIPDDPRVHLFEEEDNEENLLYKKQSPEQGQTQIRGGTIEKLIQKLTYHTFPDPEYFQAFLLTYTAILTPDALLDLLILRWQTPAPKDQDLDKWRKTRLIPIRLRVINFLKNWTKQDYALIERCNLVGPLRKFITTLISPAMLGPAKELLLLLTTEKENLTHPAEIIISKKPPKPHPLKTTKSVDLSIDNIHPEEIARQLTLIEHELFKEITPVECTKQKWTRDKASAPRICAMINRFNQVSLWVETEIVQIKDLKLRAVALNRFIFIAQKCLELNNYNAVMEILSGLNSSAIFRLKQTWALLPARSLQLYESLVSLMDGEGNFANYRQALKASVPPVVPYLGMNLTDLVFIDDGNPDKIPNTNLINFAKLALTASVFRDMQQYQKTPYCLEKVAVVQDFLMERKVLDVEELYRISCEQEAKTPRRKPQRTSESPKENGVL